MAGAMRKAGKALLTYFHDADPAAIADALDFFVAHRVDCLVMDGRDDLDDRIKELIAKRHAGDLLRQWLAWAYRSTG